MGYTTNSGYVASSGGGSFGGEDETLGLNNALILDDDGDTAIEAVADDQIRFTTAGIARFDVKGGRISLGNSGGIESDNAGQVELGRDYRGWGALFLNEVSAPTVADSDNVAVYGFDNGGTSELRVKFPNGTVKTIATDV